MSTPSLDLFESLPADDSYEGGSANNLSGSGWADWSAPKDLTISETSEFDLSTQESPRGVADRFLASDLCVDQVIQKPQAPPASTRQSERRTWSSSSSKSLEDLPPKRNSSSGRTGSKNNSYSGESNFPKLEEKQREPDPDRRSQKDRSKILASRRELAISPPMDEPPPLRRQGTANSEGTRLSRSNRGGESESRGAHRRQDRGQETNDDSRPRRSMDESRRERRRRADRSQLDSSLGSTREATGSSVARGSQRNLDVSGKRNSAGRSPKRSSKSRASKPRSSRNLDNSAGDLSATGNVDEMENSTSSIPESGDGARMKRSSRGRRDPGTRLRSEGGRMRDDSDKDRRRMKDGSEKDRRRMKDNSDKDRRRMKDGSDKERRISGSKNRRSREGRRTSDQSKRDSDRRMSDSSKRDGRRSLEEGSKHRRPRKRDGNERRQRRERVLRNKDTYIPPPDKDVAKQGELDDFPSLHKAGPNDVAPSPNRRPSRSSGRRSHQSPLDMPPMPEEVEEEQEDIFETTWQRSGPTRTARSRRSLVGDGVSNPRMDGRRAMGTAQSNTPATGARRPGRDRGGANVRQTQLANMVFLQEEESDVPTEEEDQEEVEEVDDEGPGLLEDPDEIEPNIDISSSEHQQSTIKSLKAAGKVAVKASTVVAKTSANVAGVGAKVAGKAAGKGAKVAGKAAGKGAKVAGKAVGAVLGLRKKKKALGYTEGEHSTAGLVYEDTVEDDNVGMDMWDAESD